MKSMKTLFAILFVMLVSMQGCNAISNLTTISKDFSIDVTNDFVAAGTTTTLHQTDTLDLTKASSDFDKYKDNVSNLTVDSAWFTITEQPNPTTLVLTGGTYNVSALDLSGTTLFASIS